MKKIRIFLVRQFALNRLTKVLGFIGPYRSTLRCTRIIYPLVVLTGYFWVQSPDYPHPTTLALILMIAMIISLLIGFVYFRFFPVKWDELDDFQKYQFGYMKEESLTKEQFEEWKDILRELSLRYPELY